MQHDIIETKISDVILLNEKIRKININRRCDLQAFLLSRSAVKFLNNKENDFLAKHALSGINGCGVYLYINEDKVLEFYIGESEQCISRLNTHINRGKIFQKAIIFVSSRNHNLNKYDVLLLESLLIKKAKLQKKWNLSNSKIKTKTIDNAMAEDKYNTKEAFRDVQKYLDIINYNFFKAEEDNLYLDEENEENFININQDNEEDILYCVSEIQNQKIIDAKAIYIGNGLFRISAKSIFQDKKISDSFYENLKQELIVDNVLEKKHNTLTFMKHYVLREDEAQAIIFAADSTKVATWKNKQGEPYSLGNLGNKQIKKNSIVETILYCKSKQLDIEAKARYISNEEFKVLKDSQVRIDTTNSFRTYKALRDDLIDSGILQLQGDKYIFSQDYIFKSPSSAGSIVLGRETNGRLWWQDNNHTNLGDLLLEQNFKDISNNNNNNSDNIKKSGSVLINKKVVNDKLLKSQNFVKNNKFNEINNLENTILYCKLASQNIQAKGIYLSSGELKVLKTSQARLDITPTFDCHKIREKLINSGILQPQGDKYVFLKDYIFSSPSSASSIIQGRKTNGYNEWLSDNKETLKTLLGNNKNE